MNALKISFKQFLYVAGVSMVMACAKTSGYRIIEAPSDNVAQTVTAGDELNVSNTVDQGINDALLATSISKTSCGESPITSTGNILFTLVTGAVIDTTRIDSGFIKITYFGKNADGTKGLTGETDVQLVIENGKVVPWNTQGTIMDITFKQYEIIDLQTNKQLWLDGPCTMVNTTGGLLRDVSHSLIPLGDSISDRARAHIAFTYNDNQAIIQSWTWDFSQHRTFIMKDTAINSVIYGDTTVNEAEDVSTWGTSRLGEDFYTSTTTSVSQTIPGSFLLSDPLDGRKDINGIAEPIISIYGVDQQGNTVNVHPYGYRVTWYRTGTRDTVIAY
jgi:hypothetical protein